MTCWISCVEATWPSKVADPQSEKAAGTSKLGGNGPSMGQDMNEQAGRSLWIAEDIIRESRSIRFCSSPLHMSTDNARRSTKVALLALPWIWFNWCPQLQRVVIRLWSDGWCVFSTVKKDLMICTLMWILNDTERVHPISFRWVLGSDSSHETLIIWGTCHIHSVVRSGACRKQFKCSLSKGMWYYCTQVWGYTTRIHVRKQVATVDKHT